MYGFRAEDPPTNLTREERLLIHKGGFLSVYGRRDFARAYAR